MTDERTNEELVIAYQNGENTLEELYTRNDGLIGSVHKQWRNLDKTNQDDLWGILTESFFDGMLHYDLDKGCKFSTFITRHMTLRLMNLNRERKYKKHESNYRFVNDSQDMNHKDRATYEKGVINFAVDTYDALFSGELANIVLDSIKDYTPVRQEYIKDYLFNGMSMTDIGEKYGVSRQAVRQGITRGLEPIKTRLIREDWV